MTRCGLWVIVLVIALLASGCIKPKITVFPDATEPLKEHTLQGEGHDKILLIPVKGFISDSSRGFPLHHKTSMVQEIVSQLKKAEKDKAVKAVLLKVDSSGGSVSASDVLYHEIMEYKRRTGTKLIAVLMGTAASGGYYISLPADCIVAHPSTITGSVGVIFIRPKVTGLMDKIGLEVEVDKSGKNKDMGSPFRKTTMEEQQIMQHLIDELAKKFIDLVIAHRKLDPAALADVSTARVYLAQEALRLGLVDKVGYVDEALRQAETLGGMPPNAKVVVYRRAEYPDDNLYNVSTSKSDGGKISLIDLGLADSVASLHSGFYYLWLPALGSE
jgi:protease IV